MRRTLGLIAALLLCLPMVGEGQSSFIKYHPANTAAIETYPYYTTVLTSGAATSLFKQSVPDGAFVGGTVYLRAICTDGVDFVTAGFDVPYNCTSKAGTEICNVGAVASNVAGTGGGTFSAISLALAYTAANEWSLQVNANCSLAETTLAARWRIETFGSPVTPLP